MDTILTVEGWEPALLGAARQVLLVTKWIPGHVVGTPAPEAQRIVMGVNFFLGTARAAHQEGGPEKLAIYVRSVLRDRLRQHVRLVNDVLGGTNTAGVGAAAGSEPWWDSCVSHSAGIVEKLLADPEVVRPEERPAAEEGTS